MVSPDGTVTQSGDAQVPGTVTKGKTQTDVTLPAGTILTFNESLGTVSITLSGNSRLTQSGERVEAKGPTAFTPPAPPTPQDLAKGDNVKKNWWFSAIAFLAGGFLIYRTHIKAGVILIAGAIAYPLLQSFISELESRAVLIGCVLIGGTLFWAWHLMNDKKIASQQSTTPQT